MRRPKRDEVKSAVLDAASEVFSERGFAGATLDDVASRAGLTKGAIYSNFSGKDDLIYALMDREISRREDLARGAAEGVGVEAMAAVAAGALVRAGAESDAWQRLFIEFWSRAQTNADVRAEFARRRADAIDGLAELIGNELDAKGIRAAFEPRELAVIILALSNGLAMERMTAPDLVPDDLLGRLLGRLLDT